MIHRIVVMGISGAGKSTIGAALARRLGVAFVEGDALHPLANVTKMASGTPLTDDDRWPWLEAIGERLAENRDLVVTCSALKKSYRDLLRARAGDKVDFVLLDAPQSVVAARLSQRQGHFMPQSLLASQFSTLEKDVGGERIFTFDATKPVPELLDAITRALAG